MRWTRFPWQWLLALVLGFGLGLLYAWVLSPPEYVDANPQSLRSDFKDHYRSAIAAAYASTGNLERAQARLSLLGDTDTAQALTAQAQRMLASGETLVHVQQVAMLAAALQGQVAEEPEAPTPTRTLTTLPTSTRDRSSTPEPEDGPSPTPEVLTTQTQIPGLTPTARPLPTATPRLGSPYQLVGQDSICDTDLAEGLLQINVITITRQPIPGAEIIVSWSTGEEHIFTGFKPELGNGYADFLMSPNFTYSVRMADGGTPALELSAPDCLDPDGSPYRGGFRLTFQQP